MVLPSIKIILKQQKSNNKLNVLILHTLERKQVHFIYCTALSFEKYYFNNKK